MKRAIKKGIAAVAASLCIMSVCVPAYAGTVDFNIRLEHGGLFDDPISKKIKKNTDGDNYFYIKVNSFDNSGDSRGLVRAYSKLESSGRLSGQYLSIKKRVADGTVYKRLYKWANIPGGVDYRLQGEYGAGTVNIVKGRYTP